MYSYLGKEPSKNLGNKTLTLILTVVLGLGAAALHADVTQDTNWDTDPDPYWNDGDGDVGSPVFPYQQNDADNIYCQEEIDGGGGPTCASNAGPAADIPGLTDKAVVYDFVQDSQLTDKNDISMHKPGNKDNLPLSDWGCSSKPASDKGDIQAGMMAAFDGNGAGGELGELHLFGAVDRFSNNGNAQMGLWLFQDDVSCDSAGSGEFVGKHSSFDVLLISNFTNGGTLANVQAFYWLDPDYSACISGGGNAASCASLRENGDECVGDPGNDNIPECDEEGSDDLIEVPFITANLCSAGQQDSELCAETNVTDLQPIWPTGSKTGGDGVLANNMYFEVAINFGGLVPNSSEICLGSFLYETRASQSITANLFDYSYGTLNTCGDLTIIKETDPTPDSTSFSFEAREGSGTGGTSLPGSPAQTSDDGVALEFADLVPGTYNAEEVGSLPPGWELDDINCVDAGANVVASEAAPNSDGDNIDVDIDIGDSITCTFTNIKPPRLKLVKTVTTNDGGTAVSNDWTLTATSDGTSDRDKSVAGGSDSLEVVYAGDTYTLGETGGPSGYQAGSWSCVGGADNGADGDVVLANGEDVTCTINNDDIAPELKLVKTVTTNDGGTAVPNDWTLTAASDGASDRDKSVAGGSDSLEAVYAGDTYTLGENGPSGYTASSWSCVGGTDNGADGDVVLALAEKVTCTINNDDIAPELKLVKTVTTNDGGTGVPDDWTLKANSDGASDRDKSVAGGSDSLEAVYAGDLYTLGEDGPSGYTAGSWSCVGGTDDGSDGGVVLAVAEKVTCTINNDDIPPQLKLVKTVTTNDGGTAVPNDWTLTAASDGASDRDKSVTGGADSLEDVFAGDTYTLGETGPSGYTAGNWSCVGGTDNGADGDVVLAIGEKVTCTINNDDIAPELKLVKTVTTNDGGTAVPDDWTLTAGSDGNTNRDKTGVAGGSDILEDVFAGDTYTLGETGPSGYTAGSWSCVGGTDNGADGTVVLAVAEKVTCTINNDDIPPQLKLVKTVTTNDGGTAVPDDWTLTAGSDDDTSRDKTGVAGGSDSLEDVFAGDTYTLGENGGPSGYTPGSWSCVGGTDNGADGDVVLAVGEKVTCTINNDDVAPQLKLVKTVTTNDGGTAVPNDWTLTAGSDDDTSRDKTGVAGGSDSLEDVFAGDTYTLGENGGPSGYTPGSWSCVGGTDNGADGDVALDVGEKVTCTINNDDIAPTLTLVKGVDEGLGELLPTTAADQWTLTADGPGSDRDIDTSVDTFTLAGDPLPYDSKASTDAVTAYANGSGYDLAEQQQSGYRLKTDWACTGDGLSSNTVTLDLDEDATCTIVNERLAKVDLVKTFESGPIPVGESFTFQIRSGASSAAEGTILDTEVVDSTTVQPVVFDIYLNPGNAYQFCELVAAGYSTSLAQGVPYTAGGPWFVPGVAPNGMNESDNGIVCVDFTPQVGELVNFVVDNTPPPGGMARTIGYWKNWTSCDGKGNQDQQGGTLLDDQFPLKVHDNFVIGVAPYADNACPIAVDLIDKRDVDNESEVRDGKKMANDVHGMVAQMLASMANRSGGFAGVGACAAIDSVIEDARTFLLVDVMFYTEGIDPALAGDSNVVEYLPSNYRNSDLADSEKINRQDYRDLRSLMLDFATYFNDYNNNFACGTPPVYPAP